VPGGYGGAAAPGLGGPEHAGFGVRLGGYLLDRLLYGLLFTPFLVIGFIFIGQGLEDCVRFDDEIVCAGREKPGLIALGVVAMVLGAIIVAVIYIRQLAMTGQTWGRKIVDIKVVTADTYAVPGWGKATGRTLFANIISANVFFLGYLWMLWDKQDQTWHDKVASTVVVRT
jgi:uncharacterized RDD family membrane protein YckC